MNELEQTLQKILEKSMELAEKTGDFVIEQGTDLLQQFFMWHTAEHILGILLSFLILTAGMLIPRLWGRKEPFNDDYGDDSIKLFKRYFSKNDSAIVTYFVSGIAAIAFMVVLCIHTYNLVFILVAPKLYLIEYFF